MSLASGSRLGAYEIVALIGAGGMGEVYRARDMRLKREVAIKVLPDAFASDPIGSQDSSVKRSCSPHSTIRTSAPYTVSSSQNRRTRLSSS